MVQAFSVAHRSIHWYLSFSLDTAYQQQTNTLFHAYKTAGTHSTMKLPLSFTKSRTYLVRPPCGTISRSRQVSFL
uniref:Uncharacterized protein n=1 Tax=Arundo donax TaxID=35708 RepID=A0A0A9AHE1_ARUDO